MHAHHKYKISSMSVIRLCLRYVGVMILFIASSCYAEMYKWTDANGVVHYSDRKSHAGKSKAEAVEVKPPVNLMDEVKSSGRSADNEWPEPPREQSRKPPAASKASGGADNKEAVDYRCTLARKIIRGEARLGNGLPVGEYEIETANRDISKFCN